MKFLDLPGVLPKSHALPHFNSQVVQRFIENCEASKIPGFKEFAATYLNREVYLDATGMPFASYSEWLEYYTLYGVDFTLIGSTVHARQDTFLQAFQAVSSIVVSLHGALSIPTLYDNNDFGNASYPMKVHFSDPTKELDTASLGAKRAYEVRRSYQFHGTKECLVEFVLPEGLVQSQYDYWLVADRLESAHYQVLLWMWCMAAADFGYCEFHNFYSEGVWSFTAAISYFGTHQVFTAFAQPMNARQNYSGVYALAQVHAHLKRKGVVTPLLTTCPSVGIPSEYESYKRKTCHGSVLLPSLYACYGDTGEGVLAPYFNPDEGWVYENPAI